ncbi:LamG-like jellyroll fold domain-containing protein [Rufibacter radiotolerans]|nr:LamG-like jellyroll fold domain-containing protein [Rufibacter radiotolerans]
MVNDHLVRAKTDHAFLHLTALSRSNQETDTHLTSRFLPGRSDLDLTPAPYLKKEAPEKSLQFFAESNSTLVGHWKMEEGSGATLQDASGTGNHAKLQKTGGITWVTGKEGLALNLPGTTNRYAIAPNHASLNITDALTVAAWIRPIDASGRSVLSKAGTDGYELAIYGGKVMFRFNRDSGGDAYRLLSKTGHPTDGATWMHIAATFNGTTSRIYINGVEDASATYSATSIKANASGLYLGSLLGSWRWKGGMDEVRLYHGALTIDEIKLLLSSTPPPTPPSAPSLVSPANVAIDVPLAPSFTWNSVTGATSYSIQVSEVQDFSSLAFTQSNLTTTSAQGTGLVAGKQYFWRVHASNEGGDSDWSQVWSFTTLQLPGQVVTLSPPNSQQDVPLLPELTWQAATNATSYLVQVDTDNAFTAPLTVEKTVNNLTSYKLETALAANTSYFWRVRAGNSAGDGPWSEVKSFKTVAAAVTYSLAINEVMASNSLTVADEDGAFSDWVEVMNYGQADINLEGLGLSDDYDLPFKWVFPAKILKPGEFLLVWASSKNRVDPTKALHTNFAIGASGEEVLMTAPGGVRIDEMAPTAMTLDVSYGRTPDGTGTFGFFNSPTPGVSNASSGTSQPLSKVVFSVAPGVYSDNVNLTLSHPMTGVQIRYTLDGSDPTEASALYQNPLTIADRSGEPNAHSMIPTNNISSGSRAWTEPNGLVRKGTIVRAKAFKTNTPSSSTATGTYLVLPGRKYTVPVVSIVTPHANLFDFYQGIYVPGVNYVEGNDESGNYEMRGDEWERPASFEYYGPDFKFQQDIGIRINGDFTRRFPQKSLRLLARSEYGKSSFDYQMFQNYPYSSFKRLILHNSGNDWGHTLFKDAASQMLASHFTTTQKFRPTIVYINGEYWGFHGLRERADKFYVARLYGVDPDNIDYLTHQYDIDEGDAENYKEMLAYIQNNDMADDTKFAGLKTRMDVDNFTNYFSAEIYYANLDWPHSNIEFWRARVPYNPNAPKGQDGLWRWILHDTDLGFDYPEFNSISWVTDQVNQDINEEWPNLILRNLLKNQAYKTTFINRIADHLNTAFTTTRVHAVIDSIATIIQPEVDEHTKRWNVPSSVSNWQGYVADLKNFGSLRPNYLRQHLREHFNLVSNVEVTLEVSDKAHGSVKLNSLVLNSSAVGVNSAQPFPWKGIYFEGVPITLKALPNTGYVFQHWLVNGQTVNGEQISVNPTAGIIIKAVFGASTGVAVTLASPANGATNVSQPTATLSWNALTDATSYRVQVATVSDFAAAVFDQSGVTGTSVSVNNLAAGTTYYWRVMATQSSGGSNWSATWIFTTGGATVPGTVTLSAPANAASGVGVNPTLQWNTVTNATSYSVQVSTISTFASTVINADNVQNTSLAVNGLLYNQTYYWRVKATNTAGSSAWSSVWSFTTETGTVSGTLVGHWKLNEGSGATLQDASGTGNHATLQKTTDVQWVTGKEGLALSLPGTLERYAIAPNHASLNITDALTVAAWIRPIDASGRSVLSKAGTDGYELAIYGGKVMFRFNRDSGGDAYRLLSKTGHPTDGATWMHIAATFNGTTSRIYINGVEDASATYSATSIKANASGLYLGSLLGSWRWKGGLDEVRLYHGALSASEISALYTPLASATAMSSVSMGNSFNKGVTLYPNPVKDKLHLDFGNARYQETITVSVVDLLGKVHLTSTQTLEGTHLELDLVPGRLSAGTYFLRVEGAGVHQVFRFVKR